MAIDRYLRAVAILAAATLLLAGGLGSAVVRADANAPRWSAGDFWEYVRTSDNRTTRYEVVGREAVSLSQSYDAVHLRKAVTTTSGGFSTTLTSDEWTRDADLGILKTSVVIGALQVSTFDPPLTQASFPLTTGKSWNVSTSWHLDWGFINTTITISGDASVMTEGDVTVPAGTFRSLAVRTNGALNQFAGSFSIQYYSEATGNWVKRESYDSGGQRTSEEVLVSYRCGSCSLVVFLILVGAALGVIAIVGLVYLRARRRRPEPPPPPQG